MIAAIPLWKGGLIVAEARVDAEDYDRLAEFVWRLHSMGYAGRSNGKYNLAVLMHREVLKLPPAGREASTRVEVDHINRDRLDNRKANLRTGSRAQNAQNHSGFGAESGFRNVFRAGKKWVGQVRSGGKLHYIGRFAQPLDAAIAVNTWREANLPFSEPDPALRVHLASRCLDRAA